MVTVLGLVLPVVGYFWFVARYSVNVIVGDQFDDVSVIANSYRHGIFDWSSLWAQHNENRIFFPNLIVLLLDRTTHLDVRVEELLSAVMLTGAVALVVWAHKRRSTSVPWLYYCPVVLLAFSVVQFENSLWGFQMAWYLVLVSLAATLVLLDRFTLTWWVLLAAIATAAVGTYSSLQGLFIWPAGLVLLWHRRRPVPLVLAWVGAWVSAYVLYFFDYASSATTGILHAGWHHPVGTFKVYLFTIGDIVGVRADRVDSGNRAVMLLGLVIVLLAVTVVVLYGIRREPRSGSPIGVALILVGLLFAAAIAEGRFFGGYASAAASRYTTFNLLIPIGIYLALLGKPTWWCRTPAEGPVAKLRVEADAGPQSGAVPTWTVRTARWAIAAVIMIQVPLGITAGIQGARQRYAGQLAAVHVLVHSEQASGVQIDNLYFFQSESFIRHQIRLAERTTSVSSRDTEGRNWRTAQGLNARSVPSRLPI